MAVCAPPVLAAARSGPAHVVLRAQPFPQGWCLRGLNPALGATAPAQTPGKVTPWLGQVPALCSGRLGWAGGRCGGSPGALCWIRIHIPAVVTQCCGHSPADQGLGSSFAFRAQPGLCCHQGWGSLPIFFSSEPSGEWGPVACCRSNQQGKAARFGSF